MSEERLTRVETKLDTIDRKVDGLEVKVDQLEVRFDGLEVRFDGLEVRFERLEDRFDGLEVHFERLEDRFDGLGVQMRVLHEDLAERIRVSNEGYGDLPRQIEAAKAETLAEIRAAVQPLIDAGDFYKKMLHNHERRIGDLERDRASSGN